MKKTGRGPKNRATGRFAGVDPVTSGGSSQDIGLVVLGLPATIFKDDDTAALISSEANLIPWFGDAELKVDRYDARLLLDDLTAFNRRSRFETNAASTTDEEAELEFERYRDLLEAEARDSAMVSASQVSASEVGTLPVNPICILFVFQSGAPWFANVATDPPQCPPVAQLPLVRLVLVYAPQMLRLQKASVAAPWLYMHKP